MASGSWYERWRDDSQPVVSTAAVERVGKPLTFGKMVLAVFVGNLIFGVLAAIAYGLVIAR
jgi:hypothetical protein